jgi:site-specific DNA recombinase
VRAAIYLRQSEDRTGEEWAIDRQREDVLRLIQARGWSVVGEFPDNDVSAYTGKPRPKFDAMIRRVNAGEVDVVCAKHLDRLVRRSRELEDVLDHFEKTGTAIVTTADGVDTSTEGGRLIARVLAAFAQGEVERKKARQKAQTKQWAEKGKWTGGRRPFGYESDGMTIFQPEARLLRQAYKEVLAGQSLHSIATAWNRAGITTTVGNPWTGASIRQMLIKHRYIGVRTHHGEIMGDAQWKGIVNEELWRPVQMLLTRPGRQVAPPARKHLLTGILRCGACMQPMGSGISKIGPIYKCKKCGRVSRQQAPVNDLIEKLVLAFLAQDDAKDLLRKHSGEDIGELLAEEKRLNQRIDAIAIERAQDLLNGRQAKIATDLLEAQLKEIQARMPVGDGEDDDLLDGKVTWWDLSLDRRRAFIRRLMIPTLKPAGKGRPFHRDHLSIHWLTAQE